MSVGRTAVGLGASHNLTIKPETAEPTSTHQQAMTSGGQSDFASRSHQHRSLPTLAHAPIVVAIGQAVQEKVLCVPGGDRVARWTMSGIPCCVRGEALEQSELNLLSGKVDFGNTFDPHQFPRRAAAASISFCDIRRVERTAV